MPRPPVTAVGANRVIGKAHQRGVTGDGGWHCGGCAVARFVRLEIALSFSEMTQARVLSRFGRAIGKPSGQVERASAAKNIDGEETQCTPGARAGTSLERNKGQHGSHGEGEGKDPSTLCVCSNDGGSDEGSRRKTGSGTPIWQKVDAANYGTSAILAPVGRACRVR